jgi:hypothetical protein
MGHQALPQKPATAGSDRRATHIGPCSSAAGAADSRASAPATLPSTPVDCPENPDKMNNQSFSFPLIAPSLKLPAIDVLGLRRVLLSCANLLNDLGYYWGDPA